LGWVFEFMIIGLENIDSKRMVNLPLMKISAYHKNKGDNVEWLNYLLSYDIVYKSKVFTFSNENKTIVNSKQIVKGGTGYNLTSVLPIDIENSDPDYSIFSNCDYSIQMFSRGCIRHCPFCIVYEKEGKIYPVKPMNLNPKGKLIEILDNNFFANPEWKEAIDMLLKWNQKVNFHGIDVRILTEEQAFWLNKLKHQKQIHIAWDNPKDDLLPKLQHLTKWIKPYKIMCYVLIGYWSTKEQDLYRIAKLAELGITPFVMAYNKQLGTYEDMLTRFVDKPWIFKKLKGDFSKYEHYYKLPDKEEAGGQNKLWSNN
jgi:hypothetical protein